MRPNGIEVIYAREDRQWSQWVPFSPGATVLQAVQASGVVRQFSELDPERLVLSVWGQQVDPDHPLKEGDQVAILRPLLRDPRAARRELAARGLVMGDKGEPFKSD